MPHPRWLVWSALALGAFGSLAGCFTNGQNGDPAAAFSAGTGTYPTDQGHGHTGAGTGTAGTYAGSTGAAGSSAAAGSSGGGAAGTSGGSHDGGAAGTSVGDAGPGDAGDAGGANSGSSGSSGSSGQKPPACAAGATATFSLAWTIEDATGGDSTCDAVGGATVDIDVVNLTTGAEALTTVPCRAMAATTCAMVAGSYKISLKLRDASGAQLSEVVAPLMFLEDGHDTALTSVPLQVGGADATKGRGFALAWSIDKLPSGAIQSCAQVGAATVRLTAGTTKFDLPCANGKGRTTSIAPGSYPVVLDLLDGAGAVLSETQMMTESIAAGQLVFLGDVPFDVN
jgi:hypothetical protein